MALEPSILNSTKKILGVDPDEDAFDVDILTFINSTLATLNQVGIGPIEGFVVTDDTATWDEFKGDLDDRSNNIQSYVYLKVRMLFDPPQTGYLVDAMTEQIKEMEYRLLVLGEETVP